MKNNLIMFDSVTYAMRGRDILSKNRIASKIIRTPVHLRDKSCGYSLFVKDNIEYAMDIISSKGVPMLGIAAIDFG